MKKIIVFFIALLCLPFMSLGFVHADEGYTVRYITAEEIDSMTRKICTEIPRRTSFSDEIKEAADMLAGTDNSDSELLAAGTVNSGEFLSDDLDIEVRPYTKTFNIQDGFSYKPTEFTSYNIVASPKVKDPNKKTVIIATDFSNHYSSIENLVSRGTQAEGALGTAATTALAIKLANYLSQPDIANSSPYNFTFVFFSGTDEGNFGSEAFAAETDFSDVMLAVNLERLGCGKTYFYTDEVTTSHGEFIKDFARDFNAEEFPQTGRVLLSMQTVNDLPYAHYAISGNNATFMSMGIASLELLGGEVSGLNFKDGGGADLTNTSNDTYEKLVEYYPDYATKLADVATFVIELTAKEELESVCKGAASSYKVFTKEWIAYVICLGLIVILILVMILTIGHFEKKYPIPVAPKVKIAVFGKEFEDTNENEIIVDIKRNDDKDDPFGL